MEDNEQIEIHQQIEQQENTNEHDKLINEELKQSKKKNHVKPDFDPLKNPPKLIIIQGPPKSGKSTLIKCLVKHYTNITLKEIKGPITIRVSQKQRVTLLESTNDISTQADLGKIPDIVLTLIDASLGFEMQTFEFLSVLQIHGFPKCLGIVTHLDYHKSPKQLKKVKKQLKKRFAIEVSEETKLFFLSGIKNEQYLYRDIHNLARLISVINPRPLEFKKSHPHLLVDRKEVLTVKPSYKNKDKIDVALFGYLRGADLSTTKQIYLSGYGLLNIKKINITSDPCPPAIEEVQITTDENNQVKKTIKKKVLQKREKIIFAPYCNIGVQMFDESGDYVTIPENHVVFTERTGQDEEIKKNLGVQMIRNLQNTQKKIDQQLDNQKTFLLDGMEIEDQKQERQIYDHEEEQRYISKLAENAVKDNNKFEMNQNRKSAIDLNKIVYNGFTFDSNIFKPKKVEQIFDSTKFYSNKLESRDFYIENVKKNFITEGFEDSSEEEEDDDDLQSVYEELQDDNDKKLVDLIPHGKYIKITLKNVKFEVFQNFQDQNLIISQIDYGENSKGFILAKFKRQKFYTALLKTMDPLILSIGFHKYQTIPYFCKKDQGERLRMIKYTPRYEFCLVVFYGNYVPIGTGFTSFQSLDENLQKFRVAGTGVVIGFSQEYNIQKKLKLIGEPFKIFRKTALIKNMFNSDLEVQKFTNAKIKTVSGIRGQIKKTVKEGKPGCFRAVFEDKILMSDLVLCRTWYTLKLEKFMNPITNFNNYKLLRTTWQLRKQLGIEINKASNTVKHPERANKKFTPLMLPSSLKQNLPFKTKDKIITENQQKQYEFEENKVIKKIATKEEKSAVFLIQRLKEIEKEKKKAKKQKDEEKKRWKDKWKEGMDRKNNYYRKKKILKNKKIQYSKNNKNQLNYNDQRNTQRT